MMIVNIPNFSHLVYITVLSIFSNYCLQTVHLILAHGLM